MAKEVKVWNMQFHRNERSATQGISVDYCVCDMADVSLIKTGSVTYTLDEAKTFSVIKSEILAAIKAQEGIA